MFIKAVREHENFILWGFVIQTLQKPPSMDGSLAEEGIYPLYLLKYLDVTFWFAWDEDKFLYIYIQLLWLET